MNKKKILIIGSLNLDLVVRVDHMPAVGETILCSEMNQIPGGKGANQAYAAGRLGANVGMLGAVGCDTYADILLENLKKGGVDVSSIIRKNGATTGVALITVNSRGDNHIVVVSGANSLLSVADIDANIDLIKTCDLLVLQMEIPADTVCYAAKLAKRLGKTVILDPAPVPKIFPEELFETIDILKPNETELSMLTGMNPRDYAAAAALLRKKGVREVLVTLGAQGVYMDSETVGTVMLPAHKVEAVDTTAAGDAFTAALAVSLANGKSILDAAVFANRVSAVTVTRKGAQSSIPSLEEVEDLSGKGRHAAGESSGAALERKFFQGYSR